MAELDLKALKEEYKKATNADQKKEFAAKIQQIIKSQSPAEAMASLKSIDTRVAEIEQAVELGEIADMASMSYIAKKYFNKSRSWLYQRLNGNIVHGEPAKFTEEERKRLAFALEDMANKLKEKSLSILNG